MERCRNRNTKEKTYAKDVTDKDTISAIKKLIEINFQNRRLNFYFLNEIIVNKYKL